jgi:voltage-gated potassium channel
MREPKPAMRERPRVQRFVERLTIARAVGAIVLIVIALTLVSSVLMRAAEPETYQSWGEAVWWALQTVTTVGYGDVSPVTAEGRLVAGALMLVGIAVVPVSTSIVVAILIARVQR